MSDNYDYLFKCVAVGDGGCGKTAIVVRFSQGFFQENYKLTIGVEFAVKTIHINNHNVKLQIWDTGGQERFQYVRPLYYKGAMGCIVLFDLTNRESFDHIPKWLEEVRKESGDIPMLLVGNKRDLVNERVISKNEAISLANDLNMYYVESSAKSGEGVGDVFGILALLMIGEEIPDGMLESSIEKIAHNEIPQVSGEKPILESITPISVGIKAKEIESSIPPIPKKNHDLPSNITPRPVPKPISIPKPSPIPKPTPIHPNSIPPIPPKIDSPIKKNENISVLPKQIEKKESKPNPFLSSGLPSVEHFDEISVPKPEKKYNAEKVPETDGLLNKREPAWFSHELKKSPQKIENVLETIPQVPKRIIASPIKENSDVKNNPFLNSSQKSEPRIIQPLRSTPITGTNLAAKSEELSEKELGDLFNNLRTKSEIIKPEILMKEEKTYNIFPETKSQTENKSGSKVNMSSWGFMGNIEKEEEVHKKKNNISLFEKPSSKKPNNSYIPSFLRTQNDKPIIQDIPQSSPISNNVICNKCGANVNKNFKYCNKCGNRMK